MTDLAFVCFSKAEEAQKKARDKGKKDRSLGRSFHDAWFDVRMRTGMLSQKRFQTYICACFSQNAIRVNDVITIHMMRIPVCLDAFLKLHPKTLRRIFDGLSRAIYENRIVSCLLPGRLIVQSEFDSFDCTLFQEKDIFKLLLVRVFAYAVEQLQKERLQRGEAPSDRKEQPEGGVKPEVCVIAGENIYELSAALHVAGQMTSNLLVYANGETDIRGVVAVYNRETGSQAAIITDLGRSLRQADIVINYADIRMFSEDEMKMKKASVFLHFGSGDAKRIVTENCVLTDVEIANEEVSKAVSGPILQFYSEKEIVNTVFAHMCYDNAGIDVRYPEFQSLQKCKRMFDAYHFKISGYYERRTFRKLLASFSEDEPETFEK